MTTAEATRHLGLDLGATNIKWAVVERLADDWRAIDRGEEPTVGEDGPEAVVARMAELAVAARERHADLASIGVGLPGLYDADAGTARFIPNLPGAWPGQPVARRIEAVASLPVALTNDARAFGLAELRLGAGRGASTMIGLALGTGVGGVVAVNGTVHQGHDGTAGELGHQTLHPDGPPCTCGNRGCLEAYARADRIAAACGTATVEEAARAAAAGDDRARVGMRTVGGWLGIGIANMVVALTPDRVVIGGGVSAAGDLLVAPIREELARRVFVTDLAQVRVVAAELGTWAGAIGAAVHGAERAAIVA
jgi:glucokinase